MRRHVITLLILVSIITGCLWIVLNTPWAASRIIPRFIQSQFPAVKIEAMKIEEQNYRYPDSFILKGLSWRLNHRGVKYDCRLEEAQIQNLKNFIETKEQLKLSLENLEVISAKAEARDLRSKLLLTLASSQLTSVEGIFRAESLRFFSHTFSDIGGHFQKTPGKSGFSDLKAEVYGGKMSGQVEVNSHPVNSYVIWLDLRNADANQLRVFHPFWSDYIGQVDATLRVTGSAGRVDILDLNLASVYGGVIGETLLARINDQLNNHSPWVNWRNVTSFQVSKPLKIDYGILQIRKSSPEQLALVYQFERSDGLNVKHVFSTPLKEALKYFKVNP